MSFVLPWFLLTDSGLNLYLTGKTPSKESETKASSKDDSKAAEKAKGEEKPKEGSAAKGQR